MRARFLVLLLSLALVGIAAPAQAASPVVTLQADRTRAVAGTTIHFAVDVTNGNNGTLTITVTQAGSAPKTFGLGENVNDDHFTFVLALTVNYHITAAIGGSTSSLNIWLRPRIATQVRSGYVLSGNYAVISRRTGPQFRSSSFPKRPHEMCLRHQVQRYRTGAWRAVTTSACRLEDSNGVVIWTWVGTHPAGVRFRIRALFPGDSKNVAGPGTWLYFRFR